MKQFVFLYLQRQYTWTWDHKKAFQHKRYIRCFWSCLKPRWIFWLKNTQVLCVNLRVLMRPSENIWPSALKIFKPLWSRAKEKGSHRCRQQLFKVYLYCRPTLCKFQSFKIVFRSVDFDTAGTILPVYPEDLGRTNFCLETGGNRAKNIAILIPIKCILVNIRNY